MLHCNLKLHLKTNFHIQLPISGKFLLWMNHYRHLQCIYWKGSLNQDLKYYKSLKICRMWRHTKSCPNSFTYRNLLTCARALELMFKIRPDVAVYLYIKNNRSNPFETPLIRFQKSKSITNFNSIVDFFSRKEPLFST